MMDDGQSVYVYIVPLDSIVLDLYNTRGESKMSVEVRIMHTVG